MNGKAGTILALALPLLLMAGTCEDTVDPGPITGVVNGTVEIDGEGASGIVVTLDGARTTTTDATGAYEFDDVEEGVHVVTISSFPADVTFPQTSKTAAITTSGEATTVNFSGSRIRSSAIQGDVRADDQGVEGVTVSLSGEASDEDVTDADGAYSFTGLPAGDYTITISGYDTERYEFSETSKSVEVGPSETRVVDFTGTEEQGDLEISVSPSSVSATHYVGESECPQLVGTVTLTNVGSVATGWNVESDHTAIETDLSSGQLEPGESVEVDVEFNCETTDSVEAELTFTASIEGGESVEATVSVTVTVSEG